MEREAQGERVLNSPDSSTGGHDGACEVVVVNDFVSIAEEWDALATACAASPFVRPGWMAAWWSAFGSGTLHVVTARRRGRLAAVLPLWRRFDRLHSCANVHSPLFDSLATDDDAAIATLRAAIASCSALTFSRLLSDGNLARLIDGAEIRFRARRQVLRTAVAPYFASPMDAEEFEGSLSGRRRSEMRRLRRRLAEQGSFSYKYRSTPDSLDAELRDLFRLEASGWKAETGTSILMSKATTDFYSDVIAWAADIGLLRLSCLSLDEQPVAVALSLHDDRRTYAMKIGYDPAYARFGVGRLLTLDDLARALDHGQSFEHGGGENAVKISLSNGSRTIEDVVLYPHTARGFVAAVSIGTRNGAFEAARQSKALRQARDRVRGLLTSRRPRA